MFIKSFLFLFGFGLSVISTTFILMYLNLFTLGYNFFDYLFFISKRIECINIFMGLLFIYIAFLNGGKNELYF